MTSFKLAALALVFVLGLQDGEAKLTKDKRDFIRKMRQSEKIHGPIRMNKPNLARFLQKSQQVGNLKGSSPRVSKEELERKLNYYQSFDEFASNYANIKNEQYQGNYNNQELQSDAKKWWNFWGKNDEDNTQNSYMNSYNNNANTYNNYNYNAGATNVEGFSDLSLKYAGCSTVTSLAFEEGESSVFRSNSLVHYRFCPADSCQEDSWYGCNYEYGEYMMNLQDFLDTQHTLLEEEFSMVCNYCTMCYDFNENYCQSDDDDCCPHTKDCEKYDEICSQADNNDNHAEYDYGDAIPDYSDLFDCMEVEVDQNDKLSYYMSQSNNDYDRYGYSNNVYLGVHCNGMYMEVGIFSDDTCTTLLATEEQVDIAALTGLDYSTQDLEEFYIPQGCVDCGGDEYNVKNQWWYVQNTQDDDEVDEDESSSVNMMCYNVYSASAKCNSHLSEEIQEKLEESDSEMYNEAASCNFINQALQGNVDENGFVQSDYTYLGSANDGNSVTPMYGSENRVSGVQAAALSIGAVGTAILVGTVYRLKRQVEALDDDKEQFIAVEDKVID